SFPRRRESRKNYKYSKFLKLKARFLSLYAGFPPLARNDMVQVFRSTQQCYKGYIVCLEERLRKITWGTQEIDIIPLQQFLEKLWNNKIIF
ncbi:MAG: hypothetical protein LN567_03350, partial [Rickettsia endosymbiont of Graphium doson]|nr:hypothetical protein [Rickettsia endosymbiont of Graphium doson]